MNFFKYLKEQLGFILFFLISNSIIILVMSLEIYNATCNIRKTSIIYAFFLVILFLFLYLLVTYNKKRKFYKTLMLIEESKDPQYIFDIKNNNSYTNKLYVKSIRAIYSSYEEKIREYERKEKLHRDFNNLWIHQMKTPVSVINLLLENGLNSRRDIISLEEEVSKIENGLDMALYNLRLQTFNLDFKAEKVKIVDTVRKVINNNKNSFIFNSIYPKVDIDDELIIETDSKWIEFVINQIIQNSIKYTKVKDSIKREMKVSSKEKDHCFEILFYDNGIGIPKKDIKYIFNPFFTGENGRTFTESTGMGLYLTKEVLKNLGHNISIESKEDEYTIVKIEFPKNKSIYRLN